VAALLYAGIVLVTAVLIGTLLRFVPIDPTAGNDAERADDFAETIPQLAPETVSDRR
jgi:hypothetical protein